MTYRVVAETSSGFRFPPSAHETPQQALAKAIELMTQALADVHVVDPDGRRWSPAEFARELNEVTDTTGLSLNRDDFCDHRR